MSYVVKHFKRSTIITVTFREMSRLAELESQAKTAGKGKWNKEKSPNVCFTISYVLVSLCLFVM